MVLVPYHEDMELSKDSNMNWKNRAKIQGEVVCFAYIATNRQKLAKEVYLWDLDKTYIDTKFESLGGLWRAVMEKPNKKRNIPGTAELVRSLQDSYQQRYEEEDFPIFFITASPPQMEPVILEKLSLDGIQPMGLYCKDNLKNLHPRKLWRLSKQVGYKLQALLQIRLNLSPDVQQILWGDDSETDVITYNLYSDICSRRLSLETLERTLKFFSVTREQIKVILQMQEQIPNYDPVKKIYINLAEDTDPEYYLKFGRRVFPSLNTFQIALDLFQDQRIEWRHLSTIAEDLILNFNFSRDQLVRGLDDLIRRQVLSLECLQRLQSKLVEQGILSSVWKPSVKPPSISEHQGQSVINFEGNFEPWVPEHIDYINNFR